MIIARKEMKQDIRKEMRGGTGAIKITHLQGNEKMKNCRLMGELEIPVNGSIGEHQHNEETEYYIILDGSGIVNDNAIDCKVSKGDVVITGNGASHSIRNTGDIPLKMIAAIITD